ncbi:MAG: T9SS type A sorting domain-containing protein [Bacteroidales bacterium]
MKKPHLLLFLLAFATSVFAHDYQLVRSDRVCMYQFVYGNTDLNKYVGLRIDSVKQIGSDSLFYPNIHLQQKGSYYRIDGSWIGKRVVVKANGDNFIINSENDSILIKTQSVLKDSWIVYKKNNVMKITAEVTGIEKKSFLDMEDSVKTITFHVYDASMQPMPNQFEGSQIKISKNFGLIESLPFYAFPNVISDNQVLHCSLSGMTNPKVGVQNLTAEDIFDFQVGDEFHTVYAKGVSLGFANKDSVMTINRILERSSIGNNITYKIDVNERHYQLDWSTQVITNVVKQDTISIDPFNIKFSTLPGEIKVITESENVQSVNMYADNSKSFRSMYLVNSGSGNWSEAIVTNDMTCSDNVYYKGYGGPYYNCKGSFTYENRSLIYSKKGGVETGTKLVISSIPTVYIENSLKISSTIGCKELTAKIASSELPARLEVLSVSGTVVFGKSIDTESSTISLQSLPAGAYLYRVRGDNGRVMGGKLILK